MCSRKHLTVISPLGFDYSDDTTLCRSIAEEQGVEVSVLRSIPEIYTLLSDPNFQTRVIAIDIGSLYAEKSVAAWEMINTINTLIKSTVYRDSQNKTQKRTTVIVAGVTLKTDPKIIKDFLSLNDNIRGVFPRGQGFTKEEKANAMAAFQSGEFHVPKKINSLIKTKKQKTKKDEIKLTPRQCQVLTLIQEKGASNKIIAKTLKISESTVKLHVGHVLKKYGVKNRTQLALFSRAAI